MVLRLLVLCDSVVIIPFMVRLSRFWLSCASRSAVRGSLTLTRAPSS